MRGRGWLLALGLMALPLQVAALEGIRPPARPAQVSTAAPTQAAPAAVAAPSAAIVSVNRSVRPPPRPQVNVAPISSAASLVAGGASGTRLEPAPEVITQRPKERGGLFGNLFRGGEQKAQKPEQKGTQMASSREQAPARSAKGSVCGDPAIRGEVIAAITGRVKGCGVAKPVRVTEVDGVKLSTPATLDCDTAIALRRWVTNGLKPAFGRTEIKSLRVAAHYACRPRNNRAGAQISEHGRGKAIDISGIILTTGKEISVLRDYRNTQPARQAYKAACGTFGTTLGPGSDRYHNDHFHFDTARHRNGAYCR